MDLFLVYFFLFRVNDIVIPSAALTLASRSINHSMRRFEVKATHIYLQLS